MRTHKRLLADLHRLVWIVEAVDLDNPPRGREAVRVLNRLSIGRSDVDHDLSFLIDWISTVNGAGSADRAEPPAQAIDHSPEGAA